MDTIKQVYKDHMVDNGRHQFAAMAVAMAYAAKLPRMTIARMIKAKRGLTKLQTEKGTITMSTSKIADIVNSKLDSIPAKGNKEITQSKYGSYFRVKNSMGAGEYLHAYWAAILIEVGVITKEGKRTGRPGSIEKIETVCTPGKTAIKWHGKTKDNLILDGDKVRVADHYAPKLEGYAKQYAPLVEAYLHMMHTGENLEGRILGGTKKNPQKAAIAQVK